MRVPELWHSADAKPPPAGGQEVVSRSTSSDWQDQILVEPDLELEPFEPELELELTQASMPFT